MEDLHEDDLENAPRHYQPPAKDKLTKSSQPLQAFEPEREKARKATTLRPESYREEEASGDFKIIKPEDFYLKYRPEDYSINERILNAKFVREEQEKTRKFIMNRIDSDIQIMEAKANELEKNIQETGQETKELEKKTQQMWQEVERRKFEMKANEILAKIDEARDVENEIEDKDRLDSFFRANKALYEEIDRALEEGDELGEEETIYIEQDTERSRYSMKSGNLGYGRKGSSELRNAKVGAFSSKGTGRGGYNSVNARPKKGLDQTLGRKNIVKAVKQSQTRNPPRTNVGAQNGQGGSTSYKREVVVKNPKKVEDALRKAKEIADLY